MTSRSKYHSKKITRDGITFDSIKEYQRYCELYLLEKAGAITDLQRQVKYVLLPAQYRQFFDKKAHRWKNRCVEREVCYIADFVFKDSNGVVHVEDTKGFKTRDFVIKRKLMLYIHNIQIEET